MMLLSTSLTAQKPLNLLGRYFKMADTSNTSIKRGNQAIQTKKLNYQAAKLSVLPKLNLVGTYQYLSNPLTINLQTVREGIIDGTSTQNVNAANKVYNEITGNNLSSAAQDAIYEGSSKVLNKVYPDYNPELSRQSYFTAGAMLTVPIYMGGKHAAAKNMANAALESSKLNLKLTKENIYLLIANQYFKACYFNNMLSIQNRVVAAYKTTNNEVQSLVKNEIIPPYQAHWAKIALLQASTKQNNLAIDKKSALATLQQLVGSDTLTPVSDSLQTVSYTPPLTAQSYDNNAKYNWLESKTELAKTMIKVNRSTVLPNIVGTANYQFFREQLPVITPPWMIGISFQWNVFSFFENTKHIKAAKSLLKESQLIAQAEKEHLITTDNLIRKKLLGLNQQMNVNKVACQEAEIMVSMVKKRFHNGLASVKDVNDALKVLYHSYQLYYTTVLTYNLVTVSYLNLTGNTRTISHYIK